MAFVPIRTKQSSIRPHASLGFLFTLFFLCLFLLEPVLVLEPVDCNFVVLGAEWAAALGTERAAAAPRCAIRALLMVAFTSAIAAVILMKEERLFSILA